MGFIFCLSSALVLWCILAICRTLFLVREAATPCDNVGAPR